MSRVCHECGYNVENPFYDVSGHFRQNSLIAMSDMSCSLCQKEITRIECVLTKEAPEGISFIIDGVTGEVGGLTGTVQITSNVYKKHNVIRYLSLEDARKFLLRSVKTLLREPRWIERIEKDWREAKWASREWQKLSPRFAIVVSRKPLNAVTYHSGYAMLPREVILCPEFVAKQIADVQGITKFSLCSREDLERELREELKVEEVKLKYRVLETFEEWKKL